MIESPLTLETIAPMMRSSNHSPKILSPRERKLKKEQSYWAQTSILKTAESPCRRIAKNIPKDKALAFVVPEKGQMRDNFTAKLKAMGAKAIEVKAIEVKAIEKKPIELKSMEVKIIEKPCWDLQTQSSCDRIPPSHLMDMFNRIPPNTEFHAAIHDIYHYQQICSDRSNMLTAFVAEYDQYGMIITLAIDTSRIRRLVYSYLRIFWVDFPETVFNWSINERLLNSRNRLPKGSSFQVIIKEMKGTNILHPSYLRLMPSNYPNLNLGSFTIPLVPSKCVSRYLVCVDFEATCDYAPVPLVNTKSAEIIEFPWVVIDTETMRVVDAQHLYVKPDNMAGVTSFTSKLTGITPNMLVDKENLQTVLKKFHGYLRNKFGVNFRILTDGIWDLQVQLRSEAKRKNIILDWYFHQYFDIKHEFKRFLPYFSDSYQPGLKAMLEAFGMKFEGRHHSGLEDAKNIARLTLNMLLLGHPFDKCKTIPSDYNPFEDKTFVDFGHIAESNSWLCKEPCGIWNRPWAKTCKFCFTPKSFGCTSF
jgi:inhibitor of KinA sporulation pathway (predicted exonuclease)